MCSNGEFFTWTIDHVTEPEPLFPEGPDVDLDRKRRMEDQLDCKGE